MEKSYIFPHEFLYLLCNSQNRVDIIKRDYKVDYKSIKGVIYDWEI